MNDIILCHKELDRHTLIDQARHRKRLIRGTDHDHIPHSRSVNDRLRHFKSVGHDQAAAIFLDCKKLRLLPVSKDSQIIRLDTTAEVYFCSNSNHNLSLDKIAMLIAGKHLTLQCLHNILVLCACRGKNIIVVHIHVGLCNIPGNDQALKLIPGVYDRKAYHL